MTWKISTRRSLPPSMRCRVPRSSRATLFSALQVPPISSAELQMQLPCTKHLTSQSTGKELCDARTAVAERQTWPDLL